MKEKIKGIIENLCKDEKKEILDNHIRVVVNYSKLLAKKFNADEEVVEIASWLHDINKLKGENKDHHINGAMEAEKILKELNYPIEKIELIKKCILTHSSDKSYPPISTEEKIVATADALSHFDNFSGISHALFLHNRGSSENVRIKLIKKYNNAWGKLLFPEAKEIAKEKYNAIMLLLNNQ